VIRLKKRYLLFVELLATIPVYATTKNVAAKVNTSGLFVISAIIIIIGIFLFYLTQKRKKHFLQQIEILETQNQKLKEKLDTFDKNKETKITVKIEEIKEEIEDMTINYKALQNSLDRTKNDSLKNSILLSNLGHSIRTNLNGIIGFSILLENEFAMNEETELFEYTRDIKSSGESLMYILNNIIDISRIEANTLELKNEDCNLVHITQELLEEFNMKAKEKKLKLVIEDKGCPVFTSDNDVLRHIFINLIDNAIKFTEKGYVKIITGYNDEDKHLFWVVKDTGIGIDKAYLPDIFEPYRQQSLGYSKDNYQSTWLGLPLVKELLKKIDGNIVIESEKTMGTTVTITFPYHKEKIAKPKEDVGEVVSATKFRQGQKLEEFSSKNMNILVADREKLDGMLLKKMLINLGTIYISQNREETLKHIEHLKEKGTKFDLIFIDTVINTYQSNEPLISKIRHDYPGYAEIPFIGLSSYQQMGEEEEILLQGFVYYITKPLIKSELIKIINNLSVKKDF